MAKKTTTRGSSIDDLIPYKPPYSRAAIGTAKSKEKKIVEARKRAIKAAPKRYDLVGIAKGIAKTGETSGGNMNAFTARARAEAKNTDKKYAESERAYQADKKMREYRKKHPSETDRAVAAQREREKKGKK